MYIHLLSSTKHSRLALAQSNLSNPAQSTPLQQDLEILPTTQNLAKDRPVCQLVSDLLNIVGRGKGGCQGEFQLRCATLSFDRCRGLLQSTQKPQNIVSLWETLSVNEEHYWGRYWTLFVRFYSGILHMNRQNPINMPAAKLDWLKCKLGSIELFNVNYTGFNTKFIGSKAFEQQIFHFQPQIMNNCAAGRLSARCVWL